MKWLCYFFPHQPVSVGYSSSITENYPRGYDLKECCRCKKVWKEDLGFLQWSLFMRQRDTEKQAQAVSSV
jgi:hypothetical protein